jgi:hypothetical protein
MHRYRAKGWKHSRPVRVNRRHWRKIAVALIGLDRPILNDGSGLISSVEPRHDHRLTVMRRLSSPTHDPVCFG